MTQVYIDGFVEELEEDDPRLPRRTPNVTVETNQENFDVASKIYGQARKVARLKNNADFQILIGDLRDQVESAAKSLTSYLGTDSGKKEKLWQEHRDKKIILTYLLNIIEDAESIPRPVLQQQK